ncbi:MAG: TatD family hydrolase [Granulosicoccaceae bacterium]
MLIDSHCHLNFDSLHEELPQVLQRASDAGVSHMLCISCTMEDYPTIRSISDAHENIYASVGVHPCYTDVPEPTIDELIEYARDDGVVAVGETGLDYMRIEGNMDWQRERFRRHIEAAAGVDKPLIIHTRAAADDTIAMLRDHNAARSGAVMHCFAEDWNIASQALEMGFYISLSGIVTFKSAKAVQEVAQKAPLDRLLVETDSPYLAPVPYRGKRNEPAYVRHTAQFVADLRGISLEELGAATSENFFRLFKDARS